MSATVEELLDRAVEALGGRRREGQHRMAVAVGRAMERTEHLLVQAGTGTGKSLAYLVPAVRHAVLADDRVVVSTATLALQRQVMTRDLPLVATELAPLLPRAPRVALLKGWHNYVCAHKVAGGYPADEPAALFGVGEATGAAEHPSPTSDLGSQVVAVRAWAAQTETGDRDDLVPGVGDRAWRQVSVTAMECLGKRCPALEDCFAAAARTRAHEADVVVTNHAMLGIAAGGAPGVLPEHGVLVVDEAHELADRVTAQATAEVSPIGVQQVAGLARRHGGVPVDRLEAAGQQLAVALGQTPDGRFGQGLPPVLAEAVSAVRDAARPLVTALRPESAGQPDTGRAVASSAVLALLEVAERLAVGGDGDVRLVQPGGRAPRPEVARRAPRRRVAGPGAPAGGARRRAHLRHAHPRRQLRPARGAGRPGSAGRATDRRRGRPAGGGERGRGPGARGDARR